MSLNHLSLVVKIKFFQFSTQTQAREDTEAGKCTDYGSLLDAQVATAKGTGGVLHNIVKDPQSCDPLYFPEQSRSDHQWGGCEDSGSAALISAVLQHLCLHQTHHQPQGKSPKLPNNNTETMASQCGGPLLNKADSFTSEFVSVVISEILQAEVAVMTFYTLIDLSCFIQGQVGLPASPRVNSDWIVEYTLLMSMLAQKRLKNLVHSLDFYKQTCIKILQIPIRLYNANPTI